MTVVLLPSVFLGPVSVEPLARALHERGHDVRVADPGTPRSATELSDRYRAALPGRGRGSTLIVPHSNAGLFAPGLLTDPTVRGAVFVDALLPAVATADPPTPGTANGAGPVPLVPVGLRSAIPVDADGAPLAWPFWWAPRDAAGLYPDDGFRAEVERRAPAPAASLLSGTVAVPSVRASRGGYVAFGDTYRADQDRARSLGWPTRRLDGGHLHLVVDPAGVADAIIDVATRAGVVRARRPPRSVSVPRVMRMRRVGLVRNVNQGQPGHPSTDDLLAAFTAAGLSAVAGYRSNGTVVFDQPDAHDPADDIAAALAERTGHEREVFTLPLTELAAVVGPHRDVPDLARRELTLHRGALDIRAADAVAVAAHRRCRFLASGPGWVVTINERDRESNATPVVERITGGPATSRGLSTMAGLLDRFGGT